MFTAYENGDGVKPGTYVVTFAQVKVVAGYLGGPDQLENAKMIRAKTLRSQNSRSSTRFPARKTTPLT